MYCSNEREITFNILSLAFKIMYTVFETISILCTCFLLFINCIYYRCIGVDHKALSLVCCIYRYGCNAIAIENERKNEDLDLGSVRRNDRDKSETVKLLVRRGLQSKMFEIVSQAKLLRFFRFYPQTFRSSCRYDRSKLYDSNKVKKEICKSVVFSNSCRYSSCN